MNFVTSFTLVGMLGIAAVTGVAVVSTNNRNDSIESTYGVKLVNMEGHLLSDSRMIIERDGQKLRCDVPSSDEVKNKTTLTCDNTLKIEAKQ